MGSARGPHAVFGGSPKTLPNPDISQTCSAGAVKPLWCVLALGNKPAVLPACAESSASGMRNALKCWSDKWDAIPTWAKSNVCLSVRTQTGAGQAHTWKSGLRKTYGISGIDGVRAGTFRPPVFAPGHELPAWADQL